MHYSLSGAYYLSVSTHMHREQPTATARAKVARFSCSYLCSAKTNKGRETLLGERHCSARGTPNCALSTSDALQPPDSLKNETFGRDR